MSTKFNQGCAVCLGMSRMDNDRAQFAFKMRATATYEGNGICERCEWVLDGAIRRRRASATVRMARRSERATKRIEKRKGLLRSKLAELEGTES